MKRKYKVILLYVSSLSLILLASVVLLELTIIFMLNNPSLLTNSLLTFARDYHRSDERIIVQYSKDCAQYDNNVTYTLRPGNCRQRSREFSVEYSINSEGMRDDELSLDKPEIIVVGDSQAMGWGVDEELTFSALLEESTGKKVLNAAISSYGTVRQLRLLERVDLSNLQYLIVTYNANDIRENRTYAQNGNKLPITPEEEYNKYVGWYENRMEYYFGKHSYTLMKDLVKALYEDLRADEAKSTTEMVMKDEISIEEEVKEEANLFLNVLSNASVDLTNVHIIVIEVNEVANNDSLFVTTLNDVVKSEESYSGVAKSITAIDLSSTLTMDKYYVLDDHLTRDGHYVIADALQGIIE